MKYLQFGFFNFICIFAVLFTESHANEQFLNKTFKVRTSIDGDATTLKIYITKSGDVLTYFNESGGCKNTGAAGKINSTKNSSFSCIPTGHKNKFHNKSRTKVRVAGNSIKIEMHQNVRSGKIKFSTNYQIGWKMSGGKCSSAFYKAKVRIPNAQNSSTTNGKNTTCSWKVGR